MSAKKNVDLLLSQAECEQFIKYLKENKITQDMLAKAVSMSKSAAGVALREKRVPRAWRELFELKFENENLKKRIKKIEESLQTD